MTDKDIIIDGIYRSVRIHSGRAFSFFNKSMRGHYVFPSDVYNFFIKNDIELYDNDLNSQLMKVDKFSDDIIIGDEYKVDWTDYPYYVTCDDNTFAKLKLMI